MRATSNREGPADARAATIANVVNSTTTDPRTGAVHSVQAADMLLTQSALEELWSPMQLERLARTYWRFLARVTLGIVRVHYTERERFVVLLVKPLKLLTFRAPEYELDSARAVVRWQIERGLLVAKRGRGGHGHLQIGLGREPGSESDGLEHVHIEVEVASFYPAIAFGLSCGLYNITQSKIHVIITKAFLRSLARLDFPRSRVGRFESRRAHDPR